MKQIPISDANIPSKMELLTRTFEAQRQACEAMIEADQANRSGDLMRAKSCYERQIQKGNECLALAKLHNEHYAPPMEIEPIVQPMVNALLMLADTLQSLGHLKEANQKRDEAIKLSNTYLSPSAKIETERSLAASLTSQGRFNEALVILAKCKDYLLQKHEPIRLVRVTIDIVDILNWLGDQGRALDELNQASALLAPLVGDRAPDQNDVASAISIVRSALEKKSDTASFKGAEDAVTLYRAFLEIKYYQGLICKALHKYEEAESLFRIVLPEYKNLGVGAAIEFQLAAIAGAKGEHQKALEIAERLESSFTTDNRMRPKLAVLLKLQAETLYRSGNEQQALQYLNRGIEELSIYYDPDSLWKLFLLKGQILDKTGRRSEALKAFIGGAEVVNNLRRVPMGYRLDSTYFNDKIPLFREAIALACDLKQGKQCCNLMEMVKSHILTTTLSIPRQKEKEEKEKDPLKQRANDLTRDLEAVEYQAYRDGLPLAKVKSKTTAIREQRDQILQQIRYSDPRWRMITEPVQFDLAKISNLLRQKKKNALNLFYSDGRTIGVLITDGECLTSDVRMDSESKRLLQVYLENLNRKDSYNNPSLYDPSNSLVLGAKHFIETNVLDRALQCQGLIIIPHGPLHLLPWAGLIYKRKRLFEYCPISILPNFSSILHLSGPFSDSPAVAIVGPPDYKRLKGFVPLPGAEKECERIREIYSTKNRIIGRVLIGKASTEKAFWQLAQNTDASGAVLHVACHGLSEPDDPMHSGLILSDGRIDASEIASSQISFGEVILSGCSTGWRPQKVKDIELTGDDILGLPGAFLEAGVRSILLSIPPADDDATCEFMSQYHQRRFNGKSPMVSMQETQKSMLEHKHYQPYQWLGFALYGCQ